MKRAHFILLVFVLLLGCTDSANDPFARTPSSSDPEIPEDDPWVDDDDTIPTDGFYPLTESENCPVGMLYVPPATYTVGMTAEERDGFIDPKFENGVLWEITFELKGHCIDPLPEAGTPGVSWITDPINIEQVVELDIILRERFGRHVCTVEELLAGAVTTENDWYPGAEPGDPTLQTFIPDLCSAKGLEVIGLDEGCRVRSGLQDFMMKSEWAMVTDEMLTHLELQGGVPIPPHLNPEEDIPDMRFVAVGGLYIRTQGGSPPDFHGDNMLAVHTHPGNEIGDYTDHSVRICAEPWPRDDDLEAEYQAWLAIRQATASIEAWLDAANGV